MREVRLLLDNIRSVHNVGSIFRTAETIGVSRIYCLGTTPTPNDRFERKRADFAKVSLGAEELVAWEHVSNASRLIAKLKKEGYQTIAIEQDARAIDYKKLKLKTNSKVLFIFGNEVEGVSRSLLNSADIIAAIPLQGKKESLNVSVAVGIALYRILKK